MGGDSGSGTTSLISHEFLPLKLSVNAVSEVPTRASLSKFVVISC
jgi:hypothetical protein